MPTEAQEFARLPGLEVVGHGIYLRPNQPYVLKDILFTRDGKVPYFSEETRRTYGVPHGYLVDDSPPMPASQAMNQVLVEESWDRFEARTSLDAHVAVSNAPFSVDVTASQTSQLRQEEDCYYAMRTSFIPLWALYIPNTATVSDPDLSEIEIPTPFNPRYRRVYARFFDRYGTHYVSRAWAGGMATLALTITKTSDITISEIQLGIKASAVGYGSAALSTSDQQSKEKLQSNSRCTVFGGGGDAQKLGALSTLDEDLYNDWLHTIKDNPQVIAFDAVGIWTLLRDEAKAAALMQAYKEETVVPSLRTVFNLNSKIYVFEDFSCYVHDTETGRTSKPKSLQEEWPDLVRVGFERVDAAFLGKYLRAPDGEDLSRKLFLFNRDTYVRWDIDNEAMDPGYPRLIREGWPGVTFPRVDAVVNVTPDAVYFFHGNHYSRFNTLTNQADEGYPELTSRRWTGVTFDRIDAATYWGNGKVYFFRDNQFIRYDTVMWRADPGYPKSIGSHYVEDWRFVE